MKHLFISLLLVIITSITATASDIARTTKWVKGEEVKVAYFNTLKNTGTRWKLLEWGWITNNGFGEGNDMRNSNQIWKLENSVLYQWNTGEGNFIYYAVYLADGVMLAPKYTMVNGTFGEKVGTSSEMMMIAGVSPNGTFLLVDGNNIYRVFEPMDM